MQSPLASTVLAITSALVWHLAGMGLVFACLRHSLAGWRWQLALASFLALPLWGALGMIVALSGWRQPTMLMLGTCFVLLCGLVSFCRHLQQLPWRRSDYWASLSPLERGLCRVFGGIHVVHLLYAAQPQTQYDQLNYHLVLAKRMLSTTVPTSLHDSHLYLASIFEYAQLWPRILAPRADIFLVSVGQLSIYFAVYLTLLLGWWAIGRKPTYLLGAAAVYPALLPNAEMLRIAKPDGLLFAGFSLCLLSLVGGRRGREWTYILPTTLALKFTSFPASAALVPLFVWRRYLSRLSRKEAATFFLVPSLLLLVVFKNIYLGGSPLYPADLKFFSTVRLYAAASLEYWRTIAAGKEAALAGTGPVYLLRQQPMLALALGMAGFSGRWQPRRFWLVPALFMAAYALVWPAFFAADIYSRFVAPFSAALLVICCFGLTAMWRRHPKIGAAFILLCGLSTAALDVEVRRLWHFQQRSWHDYTASSDMSYAAAEFVNSISTPADTVLLDDPEAYYFNANTLFSALTGPELQLWQDLTRDPVVAAARYRVTAMVRRHGAASANLLSQGPFATVWESLAPTAKLQRIGPVEIIYGWR